MKAVSNQLFHGISVSIVALLVYVSVNVFALQFMDERNSVIGGTLIPNTDHWPVAKQMLSGREITHVYLPPGFSVYIAAAVKASEYWGGSYFSWRLLQDSLSTAITASIVMAFMFYLTNSPWTGWGAVLILVYNLVYSAGTATDLAMASFLPWFFGSLFLLIQAIQGKPNATFRAVLAGVLLAISGFIRPDILLFLPFLGSALALFRYISRFAGIRTARIDGYVAAKILCLTLVVFAITILPWAIYASSRSGSLVLYSTNFIPGHVDGMARLPGNPVSEAFRPLTWKLGSLLDLLRLHVSLIQSYPLDWLQVWIKKLWRPWYASYSQRWDLILAAQTLCLLGPVVAGICLWVRKRGADIGCIIGLTVISYFWWTCLLVDSINRYMPPVYPFLGMFAGFAAEVLWSTRRKKHSVLQHTESHTATVRSN